MPKTEYEKGYEDGFSDGFSLCQKIYSNAIDLLCKAFQKKEQKERKLISEKPQRRSERRDFRDIPIDGNLQVGDVVFTKSHVVLDVGFVKSTFPLRIYSRSTKYDFGGVPGEVELTFGRVNYYKLYYSGVNMSLDKWKEISLDASAEEVCKKIGISYRRE
mgnify:CR=1 FL=1